MQETGESEAINGLESTARAGAEAGARDCPPVGSPSDEVTVPPNVTAESVVEAILLATDIPLNASKIAKVLGHGDARDVKGHIEALNARYERSGASFAIQNIAKGYQILTRPEFNHWVGKLQKTRAESRLSPASLETLAVVAYKQPVMRAGVETVRGVAVGDMLVRLREMNLIKIVGRAEEIGRPLLYGTTSRFLEVFGLGSLDDLPAVDDEAVGSVPMLRPVTNLGVDEEQPPKPTQPLSLPADSVMLAKPPDQGPLTADR